MVWWFQFEKPGRREDFDYPDMVKESVTKALQDAKLAFPHIQQAVVAYVDGKSLFYSALYATRCITDFSFIQVNPAAVSELCTAWE